MRDTSLASDHTSPQSLSQHDPKRRAISQQSVMKWNPFGQEFKFENPTYSHFLLLYNLGFLEFLLSRDIKFSISRSDSHKKTGEIEFISFEITLSIRFSIQKGCKTLLRNLK